MLSPLVTVIVDVLSSGIHCTLYAACLTKRTMHHRSMLARDKRHKELRYFRCSVCVCTTTTTPTTAYMQYKLYTVCTRPGVLPGSFAENSSSKNLNNAKVITNFQALEKTCNYPHKLPPLISCNRIATHRSTLILALSKYVL